MPKYSVEGNIDFYEELYKSLDEPDLPDTAEHCLISNMPLTQNFVEMKCGHKFNYIPLFKDLVNHKKKFSTMEVTRIKSGEIRCPYCRSKQSTLLPYYEDMGIAKEHGINWIDPEIQNKYSKWQSHTGTCCWGNGTECVMTDVFTLDYKEKDYCYIHFNLMSKEVQKDIKKDKALKARMLAKLLKNQAKADAKAAAKAISDQNVILSSSACTMILKSGTRKGQACGAKTKMGGCCLRHTPKITEPETEPEQTEPK